MLNSSTAIPIRKVFNLDQPGHLSRTAPLSAPLRSEAEFGYVQRHVRKTSIDERRVSRAAPLQHRHLLSEAASQEESRRLAPSASCPWLCAGHGRSNRGGVERLLLGPAQLPLIPLSLRKCAPSAVSNRYVWRRPYRSDHPFRGSFPTPVQLLANFSASYVRAFPERAVQSHNPRLLNSILDHLFPLRVGVCVDHVHPTAGRR